MDDKLVFAMFRHGQGLCLVLGNQVADACPHNGSHVGPFLILGHLDQLLSVAVGRHGSSPDGLLGLLFKLDLGLGHLSPHLVVAPHKVQWPAPVTKIAHEPYLLVFGLACQAPDGVVVFLRIRHDVGDCEGELDVGQGLRGRYYGSVDGV